MRLWDFDAVKYDFSQAKHGKGKGKISFRQESVIKGLLLGKKPAQIAKECNIESSTLQKELSNLYYPTMQKVLGDNFPKVTWEIAADSFASVGYEFPPLQSLKLTLYHFDSIPNGDLSVGVKRAPEIINSIANLSEGNERGISSALSPTLKNLIISGDEFVKTGDTNNYIDKNKSVACYCKAISLYSKALPLSTSSGRVELLLKIARSYDKSGFLKYSLVICDYLLSLKIDNFQHERFCIYIFLAGAFHENSLKQEKFVDDLTDLTVYFYDRCHYIEPYNVLPLWNKIEYFASLINKKRLTEVQVKNFYERAEVTLAFFKLLAENKNESIITYKSQIQEDISKVLTGEIWKEFRILLSKL